MAAIDGVQLVKASELTNVVSMGAGDFFIVVVQGETSIITYEQMASILTGDSMTPAQVRDKLQSLAGANRLDAAYVKNAVWAQTFTKTNNETIVLPDVTRLFELILESELTQAVSIGTTDNGGELVDNETLTATVPRTFGFGSYYKSSQTLYITSTSPIKVVVVQLQS